MENEERRNVVKAGKVKRMIRYTVAVAASILLIFLIIMGYNFYSLSPGSLFKEKYTAYELPAGDSSAIQNAYRKKKYAEVIKLSRSSVLSIRDVFLTGLSHLETNDMPRAISNFQVVITDMKDGKFELKHAAEYYLALAYLKNNDYDQAIELMNAIHDNPDHPYSEKFSRKYIDRVKRLKWR